MIYNKKYSYSSDAENLLAVSKHITIWLVYKKLLSGYLLMPTISRSTECQMSRLLIVHTMDSNVDTEK